MCVCCSWTSSSLGVNRSFHNSQFLLPVSWNRGFREWALENDAHINFGLSMVYYLIAFKVTSAANTIHRGLPNLGPWSKLKVKVPSVKEAKRKNSTIIIWYSSCDRGLLAQPIILCLCIILCNTRKASENLTFIVKERLILLSVCVIKETNT